MSRAPYTTHTVDIRPRVSDRASSRPVPNLLTRVWSLLEPIEAERGSAHVGSTVSAVGGTRAAAKRLEAFNALYDDHAAAVHASARLMCGPARADEVTRDIFVSAWCRPGWLDPSSDMVRTQMIVAAHRHAADRSQPALAIRRSTNGGSEVSLFRGSQRTASRA